MKWKENENEKNGRINPQRKKYPTQIIQIIFNDKINDKKFI